MLRLTPFTFRQPVSVEEALRMKEDAGPDGMFVAGGTDLYPNMKRRHQDPKVVISVAELPALRAVRNGSGLVLGAGITLADVIRNPQVAEHYPHVATAAALISTPVLQNMGTLGGNLCLDTRCNYYNQSYEWRKAIDFCMKKDGTVCWVAPKSRRCWAVQSSDLAPLMVAIGAEFVLGSSAGERVVPAERFYHNDGIDFLTKQPHELLTEVRLPAPGTWSATYWKLRRRGAFDFPVLGVAAWIQWEGHIVRAARIVLGGVASYPQSVPQAAAVIIGTALDGDAIRAAAQAAFKPSKPMDNTDYGLAWRKEMTRSYVAGVLRELRGQWSERAGRGDAVA